MSTPILSSRSLLCSLMLLAYLHTMWGGERRDDVPNPYRRRCHHNRGDDATGPLVRLLFRSLLFVRLLGTMSLPPAGDDDGKSYTRPHQGIQQQIPNPSESSHATPQAGTKVVAVPE
jgi:hypothetical protein